MVDQRDWVVALGPHPSTETALPALCFFFLFLKVLHLVDLGVVFAFEVSNFRGKHLSHYYNLN
jgi:hypothetical protein